MCPSESWQLASLSCPSLQQGPAQTESITENKSPRLLSAVLDDLKSVVLNSALQSVVSITGINTHLEIVKKLFGGRGVTRKV